MAFPSSARPEAPSASASKKAPRETLKGRIEAANQTGIRIAGKWYDYAKLFKSLRLESSAVGRSAVLTVIPTLRGKKVVEQVEFPPEAPAPVAQAAAPADAVPEDAVPTDGPKASSQALAYVSDLAQGAGLSSDDVSTLVAIRFKVSIEDLTPKQAGSLIEFLGGYKRSR